VRAGPAEAGHDGGEAGHRARIGIGASGPVTAGPRVRSSVRGVIGLLLAVVVLRPVPAVAQPESPPAAPAGGRVEILSRFAFHLGIEHLSDDDPRFVWDAHYGGEVDLVDFGAGRATFYADYEVVLGEEFHAFDPNQGNYILGGRLSARLPALEAAFVFHHQSRHLADRPKRPPVDWNMVGARVARTVRIRRMSLAARADVRGVVQRSFVDYRWEVEAGARGDYPLASRLSLVSQLDIRRLGVDGDARRGAQTGIRGEAGVRLNGRGAAVELFVAAERRVDPYPTEFGRERWVSAGFRLVSR
jgi:hypothetical protein